MIYDYNVIDTVIDNRKKIMYPITAVFTIGLAVAHK
jgi:hypothetical protein